MKLALLDYGAGNLHSLGKALEGAGAEVIITTDWSEALSLRGLVLPGVGAFGAAAAALPQNRAPVRDALQGGFPCLGICLGMQLFFETSEESEGDGISLVPGTVELLDAPIVPQMGWNDVEVDDDPIFEGTGPLIGYYANSYICVPNDKTEVIAWSEYNGRRFAAAVRRESTWGMQFHPEKSSGPGRRIIENFVSAVRSGS